jgi:hypothetical protein
MKDLIEIKVKTVVDLTNRISLDFMKTFWLDKSDIKSARKENGEVFITIPKTLAIEKILT